VINPILGVASFALGAFGSILSCINMWRSIRTERHSRAQEFLQKKQEAINLLTRGKIGYMHVRKTTEDLLDLAIASKSDTIRSSAEKRLMHADLASRTSISFPAK
jgi:hypothetical protein